MILDRRTLWIVVAALAVGWWLGSSPASPVAPPREPDRPLVRAVVQVVRLAARWGLWAAVLADPPPAESVPRVVRHVYDADGHPVIDHAEGW